MKAKSKKTTKKSMQIAAFRPGIVTFLIALIAVLSLMLFAYLGVVLSA